MSDKMRVRLRWPGLVTNCARRTTNIMVPPSSLVPFQGWGLIDLPLRASNEGLLRPRVARAQKIIRLHPLLRSGSTRPAWVSFPSFYHRASASRKDRLTTPFSSPSLPTSLHECGLVDPQLRASNEHILIVRVPPARGRPGHPHLLLLANPSSSSAPSRAFQSRL
jgi:hypothetical protein